MKTREKISLGLYMINALLLLIFGVKYLLCETIMPYHQEAIGMQWIALEPGLQVMLNGFIKVTAAFFLVPGITIIFLLAIPFRKGELWAKWFIPGLLCFWLCFGLYVPINIALKTHASTPWQPSVVGLAITVAAFLFSDIFYKNKRSLTIDKVADQAQN